LIIGIDPGLDGAITFMSKNMIKIYDIPVIELVSGRKKRRDYNIPEFKSIIEKYCTNINKPIGVVEKVHAMPINGSIASFSLGRGLMLIEATFSFLGISYEMITPNAWKKIMLVGMPKGKDSSRLKAIQLFPKLNHYLSRKKDHNRAESLLITEYYKRTSKPLL